MSHEVAAVTDRAGARPFRPIDGFMENAFARRFQGVVRAARLARSWHVLGAVPGSGKTWCIGDLVLGCGAYKAATGHTHVPIVSVEAPQDGSTAQGLGVPLAANFGVVPGLRWPFLKEWLLGQLARAQVEQIIIDDAHELSHDQLLYLKELTDALAGPRFCRPVSLCLVVATQADVLPLREVFEHGAKTHWRQFRRRLDSERPYCWLENHTYPEVGEILTGYQELYRPQFPDLNLIRWTGAVYEYLTHPILDPEGSRRVTMHNLVRFVHGALRAAAAEGQNDLNAAILQGVATVLLLRPTQILRIGAEPIDTPSDRP
jgi:hypothetical protein